MPSGTRISATGAVAFQLDPSRTTTRSSMSMWMNSSQKSGVPAERSTI